MLISVSLVEHLLISAFFAAFISRTLMAGWSAAEIGAGISLVYAGTLVAMACKVPHRNAWRWTLFLVFAGLMPALLRAGFLSVPESNREVYWGVGAVLLRWSKPQ